MLDLVSYSTTSVGSTKLRAGLPIPPESVNAPDWFIYFSRDKLTNESDSVDAQLMGLTLSTIGNQVWAKLLWEGANNLFSEAILQLYTICGASPGSQKLESFKQATLQFNGDCAALDAVSDDFRKGVKPHPEILHKFLDTLNAIDSTVRVNGNRASVNALSARPGTTERVSVNKKNSDWRAERTCDELGVHRACIDHNQGVCPWGHDQEKDAEIRGNPEQLEIAKSRLRAKELTRKDGADQWNR